MVVKCRGNVFCSYQCEEPIVVVEEKDSNDTPEPVDTSQTGKSRLVIRVVIPQEPAPQSANTSRLNARAIALALVVLAALTLTWVGFSLFSSDPPNVRVATETPAKPIAQSEIVDSVSGEAAPAAADQTPPESPTADSALAEHASSTGGSANEASKSPLAQQQIDASPSPIDQVIPDVPRSALDTIRGTIRVGVQVSIDKGGNVLAATSKDPGPSRYFERLSLEAARKWTFTPSTSDKERIMLIRFHYTQEGATAHPSPTDR
jgi:TonB family protein